MKPQYSMCMSICMCITHVYGQVLFIPTHIYVLIPIPTDPLAHTYAPPLRTQTPIPAQEMAATFAMAQAQVAKLERAAALESMTPGYPHPPLVQDMLPAAPARPAAGSNLMLLAGANRNPLQKASSLTAALSQAGPPGAKAAPTYREVMGQSKDGVPPGAAAAAPRGVFAGSAFAGFLAPRAPNLPTGTSRKGATARATIILILVLVLTSTNV